MYTGPNTVNDGLLFGYDTGYGIADNDTATRFYSGEPITNYLSSGVSNYNVVQGAAWSGATPTFTLGTSEFGTPIGTYTVGSTSYMYSYDQVLDDDFAAIGGQVVTFSIYLKRTGASANVGMRVYDSVSGYSTVYAAATEEFQRFTMTKTLGANPNRIFIMIDNTNGGVIDFHSPQLEIGSTASPFVDGTRSSTKSLIDLKRTTGVDISNVSFDSTGQPTFDGTDDYIDVTTNFGTLAQYSFEWVENPNATHKMPISTRQNTAFYKYGAYSWRYTHGGTAGELYHTAGATSGWHHWAVTYDGSTLKIFQDNIILGTRSVTGTADFSQGLKIGWWSSGGAYAFNGDIPVMKFYNKALTADEVAQNFNAYKNRFNI